MRRQPTGEKTHAWHQATLYFPSGLFPCIERHEMRNLACAPVPYGVDEPVAWHVSGKPRGRRKLWRTEVGCRASRRPALLVVMPGWGNFVPAGDNRAPIDDPECAWYPARALIDTTLRAFYEFRRALAGAMVNSSRSSIAFDYYSGPEFELVVYDPHTSERFGVTDSYRTAHQEACELAIKRRAVVEVAEGKRTMARFLPEEVSAGWRIQYRLAASWPQGLVEGAPCDCVQSSVVLGNGRIPE